MSEIYTDHVPKKVLEETTRLFVLFLWGGSNWISGKQLTWIITIHFSELKKWNIV